MDTIDLIEAQLPYLRRYSRAVAGSAELGDKIVENLLLSLVEDGSVSLIRLALFIELEKRLAALTYSEDGTARDTSAQRSDARRALLLTAMENFALEDAATIMVRQKEEISSLLEEAKTDLVDALRSSVFIIEDEPMIAARLKQICESLGHTVTGHATTKDSAIECANDLEFDLMLVDVKLADGSLGTDAVKEISKTRNVPAIYITAYPETLLTGKGEEPTYLIPKPFKSDMVRAVLSQALMLRET